MNKWKTSIKLFTNRDASPTNICDNETVPEHKDEQHYLL